MTTTATTTASARRNIANALIRRPKGLLCEPGQYSAEITSFSSNTIKTGKNAGLIGLFITLTAQIGNQPGAMAGLADYDLVFVPGTGNAQADKITSDRIWQVIRACGVPTTVYDEAVAALSKIVANPDATERDIDEAENRIIASVNELLGDCVGSNVTIELVEATWGNPPVQGMNVKYVSSDNSVTPGGIASVNHKPENSTVPPLGDDED